MLTPRIWTENLFDDWFDDFNIDKEMNSLNRKLYGKRAAREMLTDVREHEDHYEIEIDLPGFKKEDMNVELENGYLTITASKGLEEENKDKKGHIIRQERYSGTLSRSFYVGENITHEEIRGKYENGVLTICVPKKDETKKVPEKKTIMIEG